MQLTIFDVLVAGLPSSSSGKTCPEFSTSQTTPSVVSWERWQEAMPHSFHQESQAGRTRVWLMDPGDAPHGGVSTPSTSVWPNDGSGSSCSLAAVLEDGPVPTHYFLSSTACAGILRRADKRGKTLPEPLEAALRQGAGLEPTSSLGGGSYQPDPARGFPSTGDVSHCLNAGGQQRLDPETETLIAFSSKDSGLDAGNVAPTLRAMGHSKSHANAGGQLAIAHTLRGGGFDASEDGTGRGTPLVPVKAVAIPMLEIGKGSSSRGDGPNGAGFGSDGDPMFTLQAGAQHKVAVQGIAFRGCDDGGAAVATRMEISSGKEGQADAREVLHRVRDQVGEEAFAVWGLGVLAAFQPPQILQSEMYGRHFRQAAQDGREMVGVPLGSTAGCAAWAVHSLREAGCVGRAPSGPEPPEQLTRELGAYLSELSQSGAPTACFMHDLRVAAEGARLLQQALDTLEKVRRSAGVQDSAESDVLRVWSSGAQRRSMREALHAGETRQADHGGTAREIGGRGVMTVRRLTPRLSGVRQIAGLPGRLPRHRRSRQACRRRSEVSGIRQFYGCARYAAYR